VQTGRKNEKMGKMTIRERMLAVYNNKKPDCIPVSIYSRYLPRGHIERSIREMGMGIIEYYPVISMMAPPWYMGHGFISEVRNTEVEVKYFWDNEEMVERRCYRTPVGELYQDVCRDPAGIGSEHIKKYYITTSEDYKVMQYIVENTVFRSNNKRICEIKQDLGEDGVVLGRIDRCPYQKLLIELAGAQRFLTDLYTESEPVLELMDAMDRKMDEAFEIIVQSEVEVFWQPDNITSDMTPPDCFRKYCMPFYRRCVGKIRQTGKPYYIHMDGRIRALKDLINQTDFDGIESLSFPCIGGDLTLKEAREAFPGKVILPNFPSNLCLNTKEEIEEFIVELLKEAGKEKAFMLQISEDIPAEQWKKVLPVITKAIMDKSK
jgi:uroporphyrinogen-III decarboxylase